MIEWIGDEKGWGLLDGVCFGFDINTGLDGT